MREPNRLGIEQKNIMGVRIPEIARSDDPNSIDSRGYSMMSTSVAIDDVNESFNEVINSVIDLAKRSRGSRGLCLRWKR